jgi:hypothetical protein
MTARTYSWFVHICVAALGCWILPATAGAQLSFQSHSVVRAPDYTAVPVHGDFNGDGREDLFVTHFGGGSSAGGQLFLSSGDGTYEAPKPLPSINFSSDAVGDFNHDGKLDFATFNSGIVVYLGNGDGTFQAGKSIPSSNPSGLTHVALAAADMNHDNKTDLVQVLDGPTPALQVWISNGNGTFSKGQTVTPYNPNSSGFLSGLLTGDFDGDGKPDVAVLYAFEGPTRVQVWYGDGAGHIGSPFLITDGNRYDDNELVVGDVNNDGRSDLISRAFIYGVGGTSQFIPKLSVFTGNANRTMSYSSITTDACPLGAAVADLNGDGKNDLTYWESPCNGSSNTSLVVKEGTGSGGFGPAQTIAQSVYGSFGVQALRSSLGTRPDLVYSQYTAAQTNPGTLPPSEVVLLSNTSKGAFPGCGATVAQGIRICTPGASASSPVKFSIGAAGPTPMRTAAVWVDGKKVAEQLAHAFSNYSFLDASVPIAAGSHAVTVYGTGWDDTLQQRSFTLPVGSGASCAAPSTAGVNVCAPVNGSTVSSPVQVLAAATITGTLARMEVWVDGVKKYTETSSKSLSTSIALSAGSHRFDIYAVNTAGTKWQKTVTATVK